MYLAMGRVLAQGDEELGRGREQVVVFAVHLQQLHKRVDGTFGLEHLVGRGGPRREVVQDVEYDAQNLEVRL